MEEVILRFPHLAEEIFDSLRISSIIKCKKVNKSWFQFIHNSKFQWIQIINKCLRESNHDYEESSKLLYKGFPKINVDIVRHFALSVQHEHVHKNSYSHFKVWNRLRGGYDYKTKNQGILHYVFCHFENRDNRFELFKNIFLMEKVKNPKNSISETPLHLAAEYGSYRICKLILENVTDPNPINDNGDTPFEVAMKKGHHQIGKFILSFNLENGTPKNEFVYTMLHKAARKGNYDICRLIIRQIKNKNPRDEYGTTPLHEAAQCGHLRIYKLIMNQVKDKNPKCDRIGNTPLHLAAGSGHTKICKLIIENIEDINPKNNEGYTPMDEAFDEREKGPMDLLKRYKAKYAIFKHLNDHQRRY